MGVDQERPDGAEGARSAKVVIVEDNRLIALDLQDALEQAFQCTVEVVAESGIGALAVIAEQQPDLVVSDLSILLRDGLDPSALLSTGHRLIIITGDTEAALRHCPGNVDVLEKPFSSEQFLLRAETLLSRPPPDLPATPSDREDSDHDR